MQPLDRPAPCHLNCLGVDAQLARVCSGPLSNIVACDAIGLVVENLNALAGVEQTIDNAAHQHDILPIGLRCRWIIARGIDTDDKGPLAMNDGVRLSDSPAKISGEKPCQSRKINLIALFLMEITGLNYGRELFPQICLIAGLRQFDALEQLVCPRAALGLIDGRFGGSE